MALGGQLALLGWWVGGVGGKPRKAQGGATELLISYFIYHYSSITS